MKRIIVGIAGGSGSGKSTVARRLSRALQGVRVALLDMDAYYRNLTRLSVEERRTVNWDHPEAFDIQLLVDQLRQLAAGLAVAKPVYDFVTHSRRRRTVRLGPADVIVCEGILLLSDFRVRELCDVKVFVDAEADVRLLRRIRRDMRDRGRPLEEILEQYMTTVRPMHIEFVEPTKRFADVIIPVGGHSDAAIEMIAERVREMLVTHRT